MMLTVFCDAASCSSNMAARRPSTGLGGCTDHVYRLQEVKLVPPGGDDRLALGTDAISEHCGNAPLKDSSSVTEPVVLKPT